MKIKVGDIINYTNDGDQLRIKILEIFEQHGEYGLGTKVKFRKYEKMFWFHIPMYTTVYDSDMLAHLFSESEWYKNRKQIDSAEI